MKNLSKNTIKNLQAVVTYNDWTMFQDPETKKYYVLTEDYKYAECELLISVNADDHSDEALLHGEMLEDEARNFDFGGEFDTAIVNSNGKPYYLYGYWKLIGERHIKEGKNAEAYLIKVYNQLIAPEIRRFAGKMTKEEQNSLGIKNILHLSGRIPTILIVIEGYNLVAKYEPEVAKTLLDCIDCR